MTKPTWILKDGIEILVPFHDVDSMNIVWHGHYAKYLEIARCALLDQFQYGYKEMFASGYAWPVIDMHIRYPKPVRFGQVIVVHAKIVEYANRLVVDYEIRDKETAERLTKARTVQVAVDMATGEMLLASPAVLLQRLGVDA
ncbi:MAG TPA: thioesterase family protein [Thermoguttaceae bacterium]|nr:thioesterase family protein [Thermoguttaceae bacterium]